MTKELHLAMIMEVGLNLAAEISGNQ